MENGEETSVIRILDFRDDPIDDSAFGITCEVLGPGPLVETVRVSFSDEFVRTYYKIPWHKDLGQEELRITHSKRDLFVRWALVKIEAWLLRGAKEETKKMVMTAEKDVEWAKKIETGEYHPLSQPHGPNEFLFKFHR